MKTKHSEEHIEYIRQNYLVMSVPEISKALGVSKGTVTGLAQRLGLRKLRHSPRSPVEGETWKEVAQLPGYLVSNLGRFARGETVISTCVNGRGYVQAKAYNIDGVRVSVRIHQLVAEAFVPPVPGKDQVNHKDGDKQNNVWDNLEWMTNQENTQHAHRTGLAKAKTGASHPMAVLSEATVRDICVRIVRKEKDTAIAAVYGISPMKVGKIRRKEQWKTVSDDYF